MSPRRVLKVRRRLLSTNFRFTIYLFINIKANQVVFNSGNITVYTQATEIIIVIVI